jgi:hypothetical protein
VVEEGKRCFERDEQMHHAVLQAAGAGQANFTVYCTLTNTARCKGRKRPTALLQQGAPLSSRSSLLMRGVVANQMRVLVFDVRAFHILSDHQLMLPS